MTAEHQRHPSSDRRQNASNPPGNGHSPRPCRAPARDPPEFAVIPVRDGSQRPLGILPTARPPIVFLPDSFEVPRFVSHIMICFSLKRRISSLCTCERAVGARHRCAVALICFSVREEFPNKCAVAPLNGALVADALSRYKLRGIQGQVWVAAWHGAVRIRI